MTFIPDYESNRNPFVRKRRSSTENWLTAAALFISGLFAFRAFLCIGDVQSDEKVLLVALMILSIPLSGISTLINIKRRLVPSILIDIVSWCLIGIGIWLIIDGW